MLGFAPRSRHLLLALLPLALLSCSSDNLTGPSPGVSRRLGVAAANGPIVFQSIGIAVVNPDGSNRHVINTNGERPDWSPDGSKVVFERFVSGGLGEIFVMNADGSGETNLTNNPNHDGYPAWSPDGTKIAFRRQATDSDTGHLWVMNADGSGVAQLTFGPVDENPDDFYPTWSPNGGQIAFDRTTPTDARDIFVVPAGGGSAIDLSNTPAQHESNPDWSPDGTQLAFTCLTPAFGATESVCVMNSSGGGISFLINNPGHDFDPSWSPDGTKIAFVSSPPAGGGHIWTANVNGTGQTQITFLAGIDHEPSWGASNAPPAPQCDDGLDNDDDGKTDHPADPGCSSADDTSESPDPTLPQCKDGVDNDDDGKVDHPADPGCANKNDDSESPDPTLPQCKDGIDNDEDGKADHPADPGCENKNDATESPDPDPDPDPSPSTCVDAVQTARARIRSSSLAPSVKRTLLSALNTLEGLCGAEPQAAQARLRTTLPRALR